MKNIICLLSSIFIISCSGSYTLEGLKTSSIDSGRVFSFEVNKNYEEVYQIIMKKIWNLGCGRASGDVFYDAKEAIIDFIVKNPADLTSCKYGIKFIQST